MDKKIFLTVGIIVVLIFGSLILFGIPKKTSSNEETGTKEYEQKGLISESLYFNDPDTRGEITKNKLSKTANIKIEYFINDSDEYQDFLGEKMTASPFIINVACGLFSLAFFNQTALQELQEEGILTAEDESEGKKSIFLEGYAVKSASIIFFDKETNEKIAECISTGGRWEDIEFKTYRDYSNVGSLFNIKIGEKTEEVE